MAIRILATADIHMGRRPTRLANPDDAHRFSAARMWQTIVDCAIEQQVDLVVLAGDVVDHDNRFFEATGPLERGLARLGREGIPTFAVAGNHDFDVFPRVADVVGSGHFRLLGRGGRWEEELFTSRDGQQLRLQGWSFPDMHFTTSPMVDYRAAPTDIPTLGILHADLEASDSRYAPVSRSELTSTNVTLWLLGHVHTPVYDEAIGGPPVLYPGSPQALDPGEGGPHGPWLIEISGPHGAAVRQLDVTKVRYEQLEIDLSGIGERADFETHVSQRVREHLDKFAVDSPALEYVSLRLDLSGRTKLFSLLPAWLDALQENFERTSGRVTARIDKVINNTRPDLDPAALSEKRDVTGELARLLQQLQAGRLDGDAEELMHETRQRMMAVHSATPYRAIDYEVAPDEDATREILIRQGMLLLETLRNQEG